LPVVLELIAYWTIHATSLLSLLPLLLVDDGLDHAVSFGLFWLKCSLFSCFSDHSINILDWTISLSCYICASFGSKKWLLAWMLLKVMYIIFLAPRMCSHISVTEKTGMFLQLMLLSFSSVFATEDLLHVQL
jgi:hypothetical protein